MNLPALQSSRVNIEALPLNLNFFANLPAQTSLDKGNPLPADRFVAMKEELRRFGQAIVDSEKSGLPPQKDPGFCWIPTPAEKFLINCADTNLKCYDKVLKQDTDMSLWPSPERYFKQLKEKAKGEVVGYSVTYDVAQDAKTEIPLVTFQSSDGTKIEIDHENSLFHGQLIEVIDHYNYLMFKIVSNQAKGNRYHDWPKPLQENIDSQVKILDHLTKLAKCVCDKGLLVTGTITQKFVLS